MNTSLFFYCRQLLWQCGTWTGLLVLFTAMCPPTSSLGETTSYSGATALTPAGTGVYSTSTYILISAPGTYYLTRDILYTGTTAGTPVIYVAPPADNVTIDLNGHTISSYSSGQTPNAAINAYGVGAFSCSNLTVCNGTISGFLIGVYTNALNTTGHHIENVRAVNNSWIGIGINGSNSLVRRCLVNSTGGSTLSGISDCHGIYMAGANSKVIDCDVAQVTHSASNGGQASGITFVNMTDGAALLNRISSTGIGIWFDGTCTVKYRETLFGASVTTQTVGTSTNAGNNF